MNLASINPLAKKQSSLHDLFVHELQDLHSAETQLLKALPKMQKAAKSKKLKEGFKLHHKQTQEHVKRLEKIAKELKFDLDGKTCKGMEGLIKEGDEVVSMKASAELKDAALIAAAQRVEHYEIAGYGTVAVYAEMMKHRVAEKLLKQTLNDEEKTDKKLSELAMKEINKKPKLH